ncbi:proline-rich protein 2-like [Meriones unguiculatus]|uniref:proline-rich protein 2-like n=1 Tax=Meriones unguiculatus TaxID=10047 RepID=UPI00293E511A|nr:proline-rich protein 2-like [Meriones unguiculatus]
MVAAAWGRPCAGDFSHSGPATRSHAPRRPHSPPPPGSPARPLPSLHLGPASAPLSRSPLHPTPQPLPRRSPPLRPGLRGSAAASAQWRGSHQADRPGGRIAAGAGDVPAEANPPRTAPEPGDPLSRPPAASPTCLQLSSAPELPPPYPPELLKFASTPQPQPARAEAPGAPQLTSRPRAQVPASLRPWAPGRVRRPRRPSRAPAARLGMGRPKGGRMPAGSPVSDRSPRPRAPGCSDSRWLRRGPAGLGGAGLRHQPPRSN